VSTDALSVLVLAGGPDAERPVSFKSGAAVTAALREAGHNTQQADVGPEDLSALDAFVKAGGDVIFPVLHGHWGEGGGLQSILDSRSLPYVGATAEAAALCMDKHRTKAALEAAGVPTPRSRLVSAGNEPDLPCPLVIKPAREGSSIALSICEDQQQIRDAIATALKHDEKVLAEQFITGREVTVGVLATGPRPGDVMALPPIEIVPASGYYDYDAKYHRDDTQYRFETDLAPATLEQLKSLALTAHRALGVRHLSRVDFIVDAAGQPWVLEVNTLPGFTDHSLLPMAADHAGWPMPPLCDHLVRLAAGR
jgi:D-alanine-D-alanine ligase